MSSLEMPLPTPGSSAFNMYSVPIQRAWPQRAAPRRFWGYRFASKPLRWQSPTASFCWLHAAWLASSWLPACPQCQPSIGKSLLHRRRPNEKRTTRKGTGYEVRLCSAPGPSRSSQAVLALGTPGFDIRHEFCGTTILRDSDAINARAGDQSCPEAKSFCSPPQSFCRADAKQERRSKGRLPAPNQDEWQCSPYHRTCRRPYPRRCIWKLSLDRSHTSEVTFHRSRCCYWIHRRRRPGPASHPVAPHTPGEHSSQAGRADCPNPTRSDSGCDRLASPAALLQHIDQPAKAEGVA